MSEKQIEEKDMSDISDEEDSSNEEFETGENTDIANKE